jgi:hypothetical protein
VALLRAGEALKKVRTHNDDQKTGVEIVRKAISWPVRQIAINAGEDGTIVVGKILEKDTYAYGYDARVRQSHLQGHHRPDQSGARGTPGCGLGAIVDAVGDARDRYIELYREDVAPWRPDDGFGQQRQGNEERRDERVIVPLFFKCL